MLRYCLPMIPAAISFWIINASDMFFVQAMCEDYQGRSGNYWVGLLSAGYFLPQVITIMGSIFYEGVAALPPVTEEQDREAFFSKIFRVYACAMFCCVAGVIMLCRPMMHLFKAEYYDGWTFVPFLTLCSMCTCLNQFLEQRVCCLQAVHRVALHHAGGCCAQRHSQRHLHPAVGSPGASRRPAS